MGATLPRLLLVTRRYVDLRRVSSALCRAIMG
ncbi:putative leader peptide [Saccharopolyspora spinosa]